MITWAFYKRPERTQGYNPSSPGYHPVDAVVRLHPKRSVTTRLIHDLITYGNHWIRHIHVFGSDYEPFGRDDMVKYHHDAFSFRDLGSIEALSETFLYCGSTHTLRDAYEPSDFFKGQTPLIEYSFGNVVQTIQPCTKNMIQNTNPVYESDFYKFTLSRYQTHSSTWWTRGRTIPG